MILEAVGLSLRNKRLCLDLELRWSVGRIESQVPGAVRISQCPVYNRDSSWPQLSKFDPAPKMNSFQELVRETSLAVGKSCPSKVELARTNRSW